jgi:hypothetical protein
MRPEGVLIEDGSGDFFGTTYGSLVYNSDGTIFQLTPAGALTTLLSFAYDGEFPSAGLAQAPGGALLGTTEAGPGYKQEGDVFSYSSGKLTVLYAFGLGYNGRQSFRAYPGQRWEFLRHNLQWRTESRGNGLSNHRVWRVHGVVQLLRADRLHRWVQSQRRSHSSHGWEFLWDNRVWRGEQLWHDL